MGWNSEKRRFELEALEPRLLLSGDPLLAAGPVSPTDSSPSIVAENILTDNIQPGLAPDADAQMAGIFAGMAQEELAFPLKATEANGLSQSGEESSGNNSVLGQTNETQTADSSSGSTTPFLQPDTSIRSVAGNQATIAEQLTQTLRSANGPPELADGDQVVFAQSLPASDQLSLADVALLFSAATIEGITIVTHGFALGGGGFEAFGMNLIAAGGDSLLSLARAIRNRADLENGSGGDAWLIDYDLTQ